MTGLQPLRCVLHDNDILSITIYTLPATVIISNLINCHNSNSDMTYFLTYLIPTSPHPPLIPPTSLRSVSQVRSYTVSNLNSDMTFAFKVLPYNFLGKGILSAPTVTTIPRSGASPIYTTARYVVGSRKSRAPPLPPSHVVSSISPPLFHLY